VGERLDPSAYETIVETAISPYLFLDTTGTITWVGGSLTELLGYEADDLIGTSGIDMVHPAHRDAVIQALVRTEDRPAQRGGAWSSAGLVVDLVTSTGDLVACDISAVTGARTGLDGMVVQFRRAANAASLRHSVIAMAAGEPVDAVLDIVASGVAGGLADANVAVLWGWDADRFSQQAGSSADLPSLVRATEAAPWDDLARRAGDVVVTEDPRAFPRVLTEWGPVAGLAYRAVQLEHLDRPAGVVVIWWSTYGYSSLLHQMLAQTCDLVRLVLQWHEGRRALEWEATHDSLTGLTNRRAFVEGVHRRVSEGDAGAVFYLDLDDFKAVNDRYGHLTGDRMLAAAGERLRASARPDDVVARLGGDEFAVFCPGLQDESAAEERARRFIAALSDPITVDGVSAVVGASVGVALTDDCAPIDALLARADAELLVAKAEGKGRARISR
jgi:diguanylate cyclase (GGDEF)-like protein